MGSSHAEAVALDGLDGGRARFVDHLAQLFGLKQKTGGSGP
jgi:hypothetical protein